METLVPHADEDSSVSRPGRPHRLFRKLCEIDRQTSLQWNLAQLRPTRREEADPAAVRRKEWCKSLLRTLEAPHLARIQSADVKCRARLFGVRSQLAAPNELRPVRTQSQLCARGIVEYVEGCQFG